MNQRIFTKHNIDDYKRALTIDEQVIDKQMMQPSDPAELLVEVVRKLEERNAFLEKAHKTNIKIAEDAQKENKELKKALEFYAEGKFYKVDAFSYNVELLDDGYKARKALEQK